MNRRYRVLRDNSRAPLSDIVDGNRLINAPRISNYSKGRTTPWKRNVSTITAPSQWWSHKLFKNQEGKDIMVHYCANLDVAEKVAQLFLNEPVLGFDMEWQSAATTYDSIQDNVSVIQIASRNRIAIFHIAKFTPNLKIEELLSPTLKRIIEDPNILKCGVAIKGDCSRLRKFLGLNPRGTFELSHLHKLITWCYTRPTMINKLRVKLTVLCETHLGLPLAKELNVRCSNWKGSLSSTQIHYAAADAFAGYMLFEVMDAKRKALKPIPPLPAHDDLNLPILIKEPEKKEENKTNDKAESTNPPSAGSSESSESSESSKPVKRGRPRASSVEPTDKSADETVKKVRRRAQNADSGSVAAEQVEVGAEPIKRPRGRPRKVT